MGHLASRQFGSRARIACGATVLTAALSGGLWILSPVAGANAPSPAVGPPGEISGSTPPPAGTATPNFSVSSDGTIDYHQGGEMASLHATHLVTHQLQGQRAPSGGCTFAQPPQFAPPNSSPTYQTELSFNPGTCVEVLQTGDVTQSALDKLDAASAPGEPAPRPGATITARSSSAANGVSRRSDTIRAPRRRPVSPQARAADAWKWAYVETSFVDPVGITITRDTNDLGWYPHGNGNVAEGVAYPYDFPYDGWSSRGPNQNLNYYGASAFPPGVGAGWVLNTWAQFRNTDFEEIVVALFGVAGYAMCGFDSSAAVFTHNTNVYGLNSGGRGYWQGDSVTGGCSDLVHHNVASGFGYSTQ